MNKQRINDLKRFTSALVDEIGERAIPTHITAGELLELLNQVEEGEKALAKLNAIEAEEQDEPDVADIYDRETELAQRDMQVELAQMKDQILGGEPGKGKVGV